MTDPYADILGTRTEAFRQALLDEVAARGGVMDPDGRSAAMRDGAGYNFDNLARAVPPEATDEEIAGGIRAFLGGLQEAPDVRDYDWEGLKLRLRTRLSARVSTQGDGALTKPLAEDLMQTLNVDFPESVVTLTDSSSLESLGVAPEHAMHVALLNTAAELSQTHIEVQHIEGHVWALSSESFFTTALVVLLDEALPVLLERDFDLGQGLLIAVPNRHVVLVGFLDGPLALVEGVKTMTTVAGRLLQTQPGGISSSVYYSDQEGFQRIAYLSTDEQGQPAVVIVPPDRVLGRMESGEI
jgi:hypothetical protein